MNSDLEFGEKVITQLLRNDMIFFENLVQIELNAPVKSS